MLNTAIIKILIIRAYNEIKCTKPNSQSLMSEYLKRIALITFLFFIFLWQGFLYTNQSGLELAMYARMTLFLILSSECCHYRYMPSLFVAGAQIQRTMYARQVLYQLNYISGPPVTIIHSLEVTLFLAPSGEHPLQ